MSFSFSRRRKYSICRNVNEEGVDGKIRVTINKIRKVGKFVKYLFNIGKFKKFIIEFLAYTWKLWN